MDRNASIVKDFTRAGTPDILEVLKNDAPHGAHFVGTSSPATGFPQSHVLIQSISSLLTVAGPGRSPLTPRILHAIGPTSLNGFVVRVASHGLGRICSRAASAE